MLSREELIDKANSILMYATQAIESGNKNVSAHVIANELMAARLLFDMAHSDVYLRHFMESK